MQPDANAICGVILTGLMTVALGAEPEPLQPLKDISVDIEPKPLADALTEWAQLTGYQIVVPQSDAAERLSPGAKGTMSAQESLDRLLAGSTLTFERLNDRTIMIQEDPALRPSSGAVAVAPKPVPVLAALEKVEVTGSRLPMSSLDIKAFGWPQTPAPVVVFDRKKLDQLGASQPADFLDYLSQQPFRTREGSLAGQIAQVRGLAYDNTLVLIDGRRTISSSLVVSWNAFDLNTVPLAAIDRIDVLSDSASAVYGSDAIGGVVNIITKRNIRDTTLNFDYGTAAGGSDEQRAALTSGYSNETLRTSLVLEYFHRSFLLGAERERWNNQDFRRFGGKDRRSTITNPGNIRSLTSDNLPGLTSTFAAVPTGSSGIGLTAHDFLATDGQQNKDSLRRYWSILPETERRSAIVSVELDLTSDITAFGDVMYVDKAMMNEDNPAELAGAMVPAANPFNPFGVAVSADYTFSGIGPIRDARRSEMSRVLGGLRGELGTWDWELSTIRVDDEGSRRRSNVVDTSRVAAALASPDPTQALNVFQDGPGGSAALLASLVADIPAGRSFSGGTQSSGVLRGPLFSLPAGDVEMVAGGEWRTESVRYEQPDLLGAPTSQVVKGERDIAALFGELRIPLVAPAMQVPAVNDLSFSLAARQDRYSDFGDTFNPQYGLLWKPIPELMLRASHGTSFRAPSQFDLHLPTGVFSFVLPDPLRGGRTSRTTLVTGGNPNLGPTEARSTTAGMVFTPLALPELKFSATYWRVEMEKLVNIPPLFLLAATAPDGSGRVVRADPTAEDIAAGLPGVLTYLDISRINAGNLKTSGVDFAVGYSFDTQFGRFAPSASATWVNNYETVIFPGAAPANRVGVANVFGTIPRWRILATVAWSLRGLNLSTTVRHTPHYWDVNELSQVTGRRVPSQTLVDAQASLELDSVFGGDTAWSGWKVAAGAANLFDQEPRFAEVFGSAGYDLYQGDLRERFGYIKLSKRF